MSFNRIGSYGKFAPLGDHPKRQLEGHCKTFAIIYAKNSNYFHKSNS